VENAELRRRFASSPVARLSTVRPDGGPHVVPIVFALVDDTVFSAVDAKPKRSTDLQRLANVRADPRCAVLVDHYEDDWRRLWWVRADGAAQVVVAPPAEHPGIQALVQRFREYRDEPPSGPLLVVTVQRWTGWASTS
jgi:PPOX class probable F420-dependent enzyme